MGNVVTINFTNNCCCGGGSTAAGMTTVDPPPSDGSIVPTGYSMSTLDDRGCKVAIWLYGWVDEWLQSTGEFSTEFDWILRAANTGVSSVLGSILGKRLAAVFALIGTPGLTPDDPFIVMMGDMIGRGIFFLAGEGLINKVTVETIPTTTAKFTAKRDEFICALAQGGTPEDVATRLNQFFLDNFELSERVLLKMFIPDTFLNLFHYSADWWPSFETDYLATISETCCGDFVSGDPMLPASTQGCQTANWIIDNLVTSFNGIQQYFNAYFWPGGDGLDVISPINPAAQFVVATTAELPGYIPAKVITYSNSPSLLYNAVGNYIYEQTYSYFDLLSGGMNDYNWQNLAAELLAQKSAILTDLQTALDATDAYESIYNPLNTWIAANVTGAELQSRMQSAINALIYPNAAGGGLANLMFVQVADLAYYAVDDCAGIVPGEEFLDGGDGWYYISGACTAGTPNGTEQDGDGVPDGIMAGKYVNTWHRVEFAPKVLTSAAVLQAWWKFDYGSYMGLAIDAKIDGNWTQIRWASYQSTTGRWESTYTELYAHAGKTISGVGFRGQGGFWVDGYRINVGGITL